VEERRAANVFCEQEESRGGQTGDVRRDLRRVLRMGRAVGVGRGAKEKKRESLSGASKQALGGYVKESPDTSSGISSGNLKEGQVKLPKWRGAYPLKGGAAAMSSKSICRFREGAQKVLQKPEYSGGEPCESWRVGKKKIKKFKKEKIDH